MPHPHLSAGGVRHQRLDKKNSSLDNKESEEIILRDTLPEVFIRAIEPSSHTMNKRTSPRNSIAVAERKNGTPADFVCKKCRRKSSSGASEQQPLTLDEDVEEELKDVDDTTMLVAHQLKTLKENRRKHEEQQKLNEVLERVQAALDYSGIEFDDVYVPTFQNNMFNIEANKEKKKERTYIYDMFDESARLGRDRDDVMQDVENWFAISVDDLDAFCNLKLSVSGEELISDDYFMRIHKAFRRSSSSVQKFIQVIQKRLSMEGKQNLSRHDKRKAIASRSRLNLNLTTGRSQQQCNVVVESEDVGGTETINENAMLVTTGADAEGKSSQESLSINTTAAAEHKIKNFIKKLYTENELNQWKNMLSALKNIATLVVDGTKHAASPQAKGCYKFGGRQMKILAPVIEKKMELVTELEGKVKILTDEVMTLKTGAQQAANDKIQLRLSLSENELLRKDVEALQHELVMAEQRYNDELTSRDRESTPLIGQRVTSRHVSIKLPEEIVPVQMGENKTEIEKAESQLGDPAALSQEGSLTETTSLMVTKQDGNEVPDDREESLETMRENLRKKLSSRRNVLASSSRTPSRSLNSHQSIASTRPSVRNQGTPQSSVYEYDSESVSSHEQFESVVKSDDPQTDQLRQQIHLLGEELRQSDDRYYAQRAELENLRELLATQSTANADATMKEKLKKLENQLEKLQETQKSMKKDLTDNETDLTSKQKHIEMLETQIKELLKEREIMKSGNQNSDIDQMFSPPNVNIPLSVDISMMPRDQLVKKISQQSEAELNRLRKFIIREQQRFQASLRRANLESGKQLSKHRNEHSQLIREVNHFKQSIEQIVLKFELQDDDINQKDEDMPTLIAITGGENILDGLTSLERKLRYIFMQKKILVKHSHVHKANTEKELEQCRTQLQKRTTECVDQQQLVKRVEDRNDMLSRQCQQLSYLNDNFRRELEPCKAMMHKYTEMREKVDMLESGEKEQARETKELTRSLEADRSRLKREVNQLTVSQICPLRQNTPNRLWSRLSSRQKGLLIEKAHNMNQINHMRRDEATDILRYCNDLVLQRFADMVSRYMDLHKWTRIKSTIKDLAKKYKHNKRLSKYLETMEIRHSEDKEIWQKHCENVKVERDKAFLLLKQVLGENFTDFLVPSIQLSKPTYPRPRSCQNNGQAMVCTPPRPISHLTGHSMADQTIKESYWQMPPDSAEDNTAMVKVTVPKILAMDVESCRRSRVVVKPGARTYKPFLPPIATLFP